MDYTMKSLTHKLLAITFIFTLAAGCASVTDPGLADQSEQPNAEQITPDQQPDNPGFESDADVSPIYDKPE